MRTPRLPNPLVLLLALSLLFPPLLAQKPQRGTVQTEDLKTWLTYLASDELEGRATYSEGLGLAAAYLAQQLRALGVKPGGDNGSYFQRVKVHNVKSTNRSTLTVEVNGQTRTFTDGAGIFFPKNVGGKRSVTLDQVEFVGYGLDAAGGNHNDYAGKNVAGKAVIYLGTWPKTLAQPYRRLMITRGRYATEQAKAAAAIGFGSGSNAAEFMTTRRLDNPIAPAVMATDELFEFLFSQAEIKYAELKDKATQQVALPSFTLKGVKLTFNLDADYQVVRTRYTRNVIGILEGSDPKLKDTFVTFGAHYDHVGYAEGEVVNNARQGAVGPFKRDAVEDRIWNGADDNGSGTATLLGVAKAFATGAKTKRSLAFIWHAGEEIGLLGSAYNADYPAIPIEKTVANLNMDMIGRDRDDKPEEKNSVYIIGSDRISTELHNLSVAANQSLPQPLKLDYELNDPSDAEQLYTRSDHYNYARKGIPVIFYTTGLHSDYHYNTDHVDRINFEKMTRIGQLVVETGRRVANLDHAVVRDNKGPRVGKGSDGKIVE